MEVSNENPYKQHPVQMIWYILLSTVLLTFVISRFTSSQISSGWWVLVAVICIQTLHWALQPVFSKLVQITGIIGILFISFFGYGAVMWLTFSLLPGIENVSFASTIFAAWIYATFVTILQWLLLAQSDEYFLRQSIKKSRHKPKQTTDVPGFLFVQLDGVSSHVLDWQIKTGNLPNIQNLIQENQYKVTSWQTQIPSTTPASQAGILLGNNDSIPSFRWYERESDSLVVANQTAGAHLIESRLSSGKGLLADDGVSIGNLFSGDAPTNIMVMSKMHGDRESLKAMREYSDYFSSLYGFMRALVLSVGEMFKELYQAKRQNLKDIKPRVARHFSYVLLRAGTNVMLRDIQTTIVLDKMMTGVNSIYVDYLDYDEIAHHAGIARPESLAALSGLDGVVGIFAKAAKHTPRPYHIVYVSDHGQSQGQTFKQLHSGKSLENFVSELLQTNKVLVSTAPIEEKSTKQFLLREGSSGSKVGGSAFRYVNKKYDTQHAGEEGNKPSSEIVVTGSGNLGNIWIKKFKKRPTRKQLNSEYPELISELLSIKGIGLVLVQTESGPVCISKDGGINLADGKVMGVNPLSPYPDIDSDSILKLSNMKNAPDIQVISSMDASTGEVYAFEELVGSHGGIGSWQTDAILLYPENLKIKDIHLNKGKIVDSTTVHKIFVDWLESAGQRQNI